MRNFLSLLTSIFYVPFLRLVAVLCLYTILRFCFWSYNYNQFPTDWAFLDIIKYSCFALRFDISSLCYINLLYLLSEVLTLPFGYNKWLFNIKKILFFVPNFIFFSLEIADIAFFSFQTRRLIFGDVALINNTLHLLPGLLLRYWYLVVLAVFIFYWTWKKDNLLAFVKPIKSKIWKLILLQIVSLPIIAALIIIGGRGGLQLRPINNLTAATYVKDVRWSPFLLNTTFSVLSTSLRKGVKEITYFSDNQLDSLFSIEKKATQNKSFQPLNVVVIAMESFGKEYSSRYNNYQGFMPFLDSLSEYSLTAEQSFANGLRSTYGVVAMTSGIPCMMDEPLMFSPYQNNRVESIASLLKKKGYTSAFFHGSIPGSMGFDKYSKSISYDIFEDMNDYPNSQDFDGQWGIFDRPYFQYVAQRFSQLPQPFHGFVFSLTSHEPYKVEKDFETKYPTTEALHRSVLYSDDALRRFFKTASTMPWFENTLFVIAADHTGKSMVEKYQTVNGRYKIPIIYYFPKGNLKGVVKKVTQQIDILPSIMDYLHYDLPYVAFGNSIFDNEKHYTYSFAWDLFHIMDETYILDATETEVKSMYNYQKDPLEKNNLLGKLPEKENELWTALRARIQRHHNAMIHNKLHHLNQ